jgi:hypothetical protein
MATVREQLTAELQAAREEAAKLEASAKEKIATLEARLAGGGSWLDMELAAAHDHLMQLVAFVKSKL